MRQLGGAGLPDPGRRCTNQLVGQTDKFAGLEWLPYYRCIPVDSAHIKTLGDQNDHRDLRQMLPHLAEYCENVLLFKIQDNQVASYRSGCSTHEGLPAAVAFQDVVGGFGQNGDEQPTYIRIIVNHQNGRCGRINGLGHSHFVKERTNT